MTGPTPSGMSITELVRIGDEMQSEASRLAEWVNKQQDVPYEVSMALMSVQHTVEAWTAERRRA